MREISQMTIEELEIEAEELKSTAQKLSEREIRALEINDELLKRLKDRLEF